MKHYTCPMHPEVQQDKSGQCPECGMKLIASEMNGHEMKMDHENMNHG